VARTVIVTLVPQQASTAVGGENVQGVPSATVMLEAQVSTGGVVSRLVTIWLHVAELLQQSVARQVRVIVPGHGVGFWVMVLRMVMVTFVPQQPSSAVGGSKLQALPHCTVLLVAQVTTGGVVSTIDTVWLQRAEVFPQQSVACHCRVAVVRHGEPNVLVVVPMIVTVTFESQQASKTAGGSKVQGSPH